MTSEQVFYFGCIGGPGHYLWDSRQRRASDAFGLRAADLDTPYCPGMSASRNGSTPAAQPEGRTRLTHVAGVTVLSFWDRSVDNRRGSHSTFVIEGVHDFAAAKEFSRKAFPGVWARYGFDVTEGGR